jgi:hypothetical protein
MLELTESEQPLARTHVDQQVDIALAVTPPRATLPNIRTLRAPRRSAQEQIALRLRRSNRSNGLSDRPNSPVGRRSNCMVNKWPVGETRRRSVERQGHADRTHRR